MRPILKHLSLGAPSKLLYLLLLFMLMAGALMSALGMP